MHWLKRISQAKSTWQKVLLPSAFVLPSLGDSVLENDVLAEWQDLALTLSDWNQKFFIATAAADDLPASTAAIEIQEEFLRTKALTFKTPAKRRFDITDQSSAAALELNVHSYSPFFKEDEEAPITKIAHVSGVLVRLDEGVAVSMPPWSCLPMTTA
jgi:hypothetical protein